MSDESDLREGPAERRAFQFTEDRMAAIIAKAMKQVLTDPEVIETMGGVAITVIQKQAAKKTGNLVLGALKALLTRWVLIGIVLVLLAQLVGVPGALKTLAPVFGRANP